MPTYVKNPDHTVLQNSENSISAARRQKKALEISRALKHVFVDMMSASERRVVEPMRE